MRLVIGNWYSYRFAKGFVHAGKLTGFRDGLSGRKAILENKKGVRFAIIDVSNIIKEIPHG